MTGAPTDSTTSRGGVRLHVAVASCQLCVCVWRGTVRVCGRESRKGRKGLQRMVGWERREAQDKGTLGHGFIALFQHVLYRGLQRFLRVL